MKWQCALLQRWLPEYPEGDLPAFWKARLQAHLDRCPACRAEQAALREVAEAVRSAPAADPGPQFWSEFSREMHVKLVRAAQDGKMAPARSVWWGRVPYLVGAPALGALLLWIAVGYLQPQRPGLSPTAPMAQKESAAPEKVAATPEAPGFKNPEEPAQTFTYASKNGGGEELGVEDELDDLDSTLAGMTEQEKAAFLKKLSQHGKDGSCIKRYSAIFWA